MRATMLGRVRRDEGGFVLVVVVLSLTFLLMLVTAVMNYSLGSQNLSRRDQDWNAALAAAEAGVDDYLFRLNQDNSYWRFGPPPDPDGTDGNAAFTTWVPVPGGSTDSTFRYAVDTSQLAVNGTVLVTSTGRVGDVRRSVQATVRPRNFLDYLYFTDFETKDPAIYSGGDFYTPAEAATRCSRYYYGASNDPLPYRRDIASRSDFTGDSDFGGASCVDISFGSADVINGPLHSNDALRVSGNPTFNGETTTSYDGSLTSGQMWWGSGSPTFANAGDPSFATPLTMPPSNTTIKNETLNTAAGGCLFTGPTAIRLNANGTMDVISPFTRVTTGTAGQSCTATYSPNNNLYYTEASSNGYHVTNMTLPANGVIYVQNVPSSPVTDPNYTAPGCPMSRPQIGGGGANVTHPLGFPQLYDLTPSSAGTTPSGYGCRNGDVFLMGTLDGRLTIAAENNIVMYGDTTYENASDDILGLVANNYVEVYHPARNDGISTNCDGSITNGGCSLRRPTATSTTTPSLFSTTSGGAGTATMATETSGSSTAFRNAVIKAAILTVQHSFRVQWYQYGDDNTMGTLNVTGAITQKYRGIVGLLGTTGYAKNYLYDTRLKYDSPPKFLNPVASAWGIVTWAECRTAVCNPPAA